MKSLLIRVLLCGVALLNAGAGNATKQAEDAFHKLWFSGSVDEAFAKAKKENRRIFLYWGAVWCPPCNELKSNVFNTPEFKQRMLQVVPVYIDGDAPSAQMISDRFKTTGYPTLLMIDANGNELFRIDEGVSIAEFMRIFDAAVMADADLQTIVQRALEGKATRDDWRILAFYSWSPGESLGKSRPELLSTWLELQARVPPEMVEENSLLSAKILGLAASGSDEERKDPSYAKVKERQQQLLGAMFADDVAIGAARMLLVYSPQEVIEFLYPQPGVPARQRLVKRWTDALVTLRRRSDLTLSVRLLLTDAKLTLFTIENPGKKLLPALKAELLGAVNSTDRAARTEFARHAVIPDAAAMLNRYGEGEKARELLLREVKTTDTPWYYWSMLASFENKAGNKDKALEYSTNARTTAKGTATKIQWHTNDLLLHLKLKPESPAVNELVESYYQLVFSQPNGFSGRNKNRSDRVASELHAKIETKGLKDIATKYQKQCEQLVDAAKADCLAHFKAIF